MLPSLTLRVPEVLVSDPQWVGWRLETRDGKPTKIPINPRSGHRAATDQPATWGTLQEAQAAVSRYQLSGIGFVFVAGGGIVGVDLDKCRDATSGDIEPWAQDIIKELDSYTEISPSGTGLHVLLHGELPDGSRRKGRVEMYDRGRYFTMTGNHLPGTPHTINTRDAELLAVYAQVFGAIEQAPRNGSATSGRPAFLSDRDLVQRATNAKNGAKFSNLWSGNWQGDYSSQSEADAALCVLLAFWTGKDAGRIDTLFRQSGLYRTKWDEKHYGDGRTYGEQTISQAILRTTDSYTSTSSTHGASASPATDIGPTKINAKNQNLQSLTAETWEAIQQANKPPRLFHFGGLPSRMETDDAGFPILRELTIDRLRHEVARAAYWFCFNRDEEPVPAKPPLDLIRDMLASPALPLPRLVRVVETPVFGKSGALLATPGYQSSDGLYYASSADVTIPAVPRRPTPQEVHDAKHLLLEKLLGDFPFANESSRAHALSCLLLPFVRDMIDGPTPLHLIEKPTPRTGGTLLAEILMLPALGKAVNHLTESRDSDEWRKLITAELARSPLALCFDNIRRRLDSGALASALTATVWSDRVLGHSEIIKLPVRTVWLATGNNPTLSDEILGRTIFIRLDAHLDRPQDRGPFRHPLPAWALNHRGELIHAALVLCQSWIAAGRPAGTRRKGRFEEWAEVLGGILTHHEISDFLLEQDCDIADPETQAWLAFVRLWWERHKEAVIGVSMIFEIIHPAHAPDLYDPIDLDLGDGSPRSQKIKLGYQLLQRRDRQFSVNPEYRLKLVSAGERQGAKQWKLVPIYERKHESDSCESRESFRSRDDVHA